MGQGYSVAQTGIRSCSLPTAQTTMANGANGSQSGEGIPAPGKSGEGVERMHSSSRRHRSLFSRSHRHHSSRGGHTDGRLLQHRISQRRALAVAALVFAACACVFLALWLREASRLREQRLEGARELDAAKARAASLEGKLRETEEQLAALAAGRLPKPLLALEPDALIDLSAVNPVLQKVLFTQVGSRSNPKYEYRLHCRNPGEQPYQPRFLILVFSRSGIQTGSADVTRSPDWVRLGPGGLGPGEACSFSGSVEMLFEDDPGYFTVLEVPLGSKPPRLVP